MRIPSSPKAQEAPPRSLPRKPEASPTAPIWKPQEVGLTRQELRAIVIDVIG
jgi:hypothetical protein